MNPTISIIIPVYNQEKYLSRCLDSILAQTFTDFEVICVNDHSTDSTAEILKEYSEKDSRIVAFDNPDKGVCSARNFGIDNAKGEYIGFVDSDDFIQPQMYEFLYRAITENSCNMVACRYEKTTEPENKVFEYRCRKCRLSEFVDLYNFDFMMRNEMIISGVWSKLIKKEFLKKNTVFENYRICEDTLFCANLWVNVETPYLVDVPLYGYFTNSESTINKKEDWIFFDMIRARYLAYRIYRKYDYETSKFFLFRSFLLALRCKKNKELKDNSGYKTINKYAVKMVIPFLFIKGVNYKEKLKYVSDYFSV